MNFRASHQNYDAFKYNESIFDEFYLIIEPLVIFFDIQHFCYIRMFPNGKYIEFSCKKEWQNFYYQYIHHTSLILPGEIPIRFIGENSEYMLSTWPSNNESLVAKAITKQRLGNGLSITKFVPEFSDRWALFGKPNKISMDLIFIQNIDLLLKFLKYFAVRMNDLLNSKPLDMRHYATYREGIIYPTCLPNIPEKPSTKQLAEKISLPGQNIVRNINFTTREIDILVHLAQCETAKEIAKNLELSPRTVEWYIKKIKDKTGYTSYSSLAKIYRDFC